MTYEEFLRAKVKLASFTGFDVPLEQINPALKPHTRDPARMNSEIAECSHVDCPHRRHAWSERPSRADLYRGPWPKAESADPKPLDKEFQR